MTTGLIRTLNFMKIKMESLWKVFFFFFLMSDNLIFNFKYCNSPGKKE